MKIAVLSLAAALLTPLAYADAVSGQINFIGSDSYSNSTIYFAPGSVVGGTSTGTLSSFTAGTPATFHDFNYAAMVPDTIFNVTSGGKDLSFFLDSVTATNTGTELTLKGSGIFSETGYTDTPGQFVLTSQDISGGNGGQMPGAAVTFSATAGTAVTPEPGSLVLLGTGLLSTAGMLIRRRSVGHAFPRPTCPVEDSRCNLDNGCGGHSCRIA